MSVIDEVEIPQEVESYGYEAVERWLDWVSQNGVPSGFNYDLSVMYARQRACGASGTDTQNFRGVASGNPFPNMPESLRQHYIKQCREQGVSFEGKVYKTGLVRPGYGGLKMDPEALVDSTSDVRKILAHRGWGAEGMVNIDAVEKDEPTALDRPYEVADDLVDERVATEVIENHGGRMKKKDYADLRAKIKKKMQGAL